MGSSQTDAEQCILMSKRGMKHLVPVQVTYEHCASLLEPTIQLTPLHTSCCSPTSGQNTRFHCSSFSRALRDVQRFVMEDIL